MPPPVLLPIHCFCRQLSMASTSGPPLAQVFPMAAADASCLPSTACLPALILPLLPRAGGSGRQEWTGCCRLARQVHRHPIIRSSTSSSSTSKAVATRRAAATAASAGSSSRAGSGSRLGGAGAGWSRSTTPWTTHVGALLADQGRPRAGPWHGSRLLAGSREEDSSSIPFCRPQGGGQWGFGSDRPYVPAHEQQQRPFSAGGRGRGWGGGGVQQQHLGKRKREGTGPPTPRGNHTRF